MGRKIVAVSTGQSGGPFAGRESSAMQPTPRARRGDPGGHGGFTYMVMYSVRAQSSRYIGLSQSSDTMPHCTTKCSFPPYRRLTWLPSIPLTAPLAPVFPPRYSYTLFDIAVSRVPRGRYSHCMLPPHGNTRWVFGGRHGVDDTPNGRARRIVRGGDGGTEEKETRSPDASTIQCTTFEHYLNA